MDIKDSRRAHLEESIARYRTAEDFLDALNDRLQKKNQTPVTASYLSQLRMGPPKGRNIGDKVARKLEVGLGVPQNSFDMPLLGPGWFAPGPEAKGDSESGANLTDRELDMEFSGLSPEEFTELVIRYAPLAKLTDAQRLRILRALLPHESF